MPGPLRLQDLPPRWARFCLGVERFSRQIFGQSFAQSTCIVGLSGGADSTALLAIASLLCNRSGGALVATHLDHCLRAESEQDALFVKALCEKLDIPFIQERCDVADKARSEGCGLEEAGRNARYELLEHVRRDHKADLILLAHQLNDLAEDQLMRLMRGSGWPALGGMPAHDPERRLLRPLLLTPKVMLEDFLTSLGQQWREDATNSQPCATRNRVRLDVLPALLRENPAYLDAAARLWRQARQEQHHWDSERNAAMLPLPRPEPGLPWLLPRNTLETSSAPLRLRLYKSALDTLGPGQVLNNTLFRLDELWLAGATGKSLRFPGDKEARIAKAGIAFRVIDRKKECG